MNFTMESANASYIELNVKEQDITYKVRASYFDEFQMLNFLTSGRKSAARVSNFQQLRHSREGAGQRAEQELRRHPGRVPPGARQHGQHLLPDIPTLPAGLPHALHQHR